MTRGPHLHVFGFPVTFGPSFLVVGAVATLFLREWGLAAVGVFGVSILVHELGHSLAFRHFGSESDIVVHLFGGYSAPHRPHALDDREWIIATAAGPGAAFVLLGLPALLVRTFTPDLPSGLPLLADVLVWFNVYWGLANLLPIWPFDGGRILYHGLALRGHPTPWPVVQRLTLALSALVAVVAFRYGYTFVAVFVGFNAYRVATAPGPPRVGQGLGRDRVTDATRKAKAFADSTTVRSENDAARVVERAHHELAVGRLDRFEPLVEVLDEAGHRPAIAVLRVWEQLLRSDLGDDLGDHLTAADERLAAIADPPQLLVAMVDLLAHRSNPADLASALAGGEPSNALGTVAVLLRTSGRLHDVSLALRDLPTGGEVLGQIERATLDLGLVEEQIIVSGVIDGDI